MKQPVIFAGAGPGAPDLITLRCRDAIAVADLIIYAGSLVNPEVLQYAKESCEVRDSADMNLEEIISAMQKGIEKGEKIVRLHTGDPSVYGAITEQMNELDKLRIDYEVIPGVSSVFASAAAVKTELTLPGVSQSVILTRRAGRTPVPDGQNIADFAKHKATMGIFLSVADIDGLVAELISGGYGKETAAAVVYRVTWEDEKIILGTLENIAEKVRNSQISRQAMILVGDAIAKSGDKSLLYDKNFSHGYRQQASKSVSP
jgi:precorrin-4 C11-methyltransferase